MPRSNYGALKVRAKASEVVDYHRDTEQPGKPLLMLIPGGLIALASLGIILWVAYATWFDRTVQESLGVLYILLLAPIYVGGVFLFSYAYELYDVPKALRLTAIIVFISLAAVVIVAVLLAILGKSRSRSSSSSSSSDDSDSAAGSGSSFSSSRSSGWSIDLGGGSAGTVTREVVREVRIAPPPPELLICPYCGRSYLPVGTDLACPSCGAAKPEKALLSE